MGILTDDMKRVVRQQRIGFVATVCPDGTPNLSPKGTAAVWDDDYLVFADLASPGTMANLRANPRASLSMQDGEGRWATFEGRGRVMEDRPAVEEAVRRHRRRYGGNTSVSPDFVAIEIQIERVMGEWWLAR